ncbi:hypothetical protein B0T16DRAFT_315117 [Cercophora newfieldiana]|uniref:Uncharacterized protein n=1 Tax=Cercophora newfieldiana TaxID=92897 RepID=A0AA40CXT4_9PEZI|nr:hypothetical protein B0T16DRAFT_315117 [Cercophora newfieldiana]
MSSLGDRVTALFERLEAYQFFLIEWETSLQILLGYPLMSNRSLFFLVPDDQLPEVLNLAADVGLFPTNEAILRPVHPCEMCSHAVRFLIDDSTPRPEGPPRRRLVFLPMSWTGITCGEAVPIPASSSVHTVSLSTACAALVRIAARENRGSQLRASAIECLASLIGYGLLDMSHDGDYMEFPSEEQPLSDQETLEMENAVAEMNRWAFRNDEEWIRETLIQIVTGEKSYDDLPSRIGSRR